MNSLETNHTSILFLNPNYTLPSSSVGIHPPAALPRAEVEARGLQGAADQGGIVGAELDDGGVVASEGGRQGVHRPHVGSHGSSIVRQNVGEANSAGRVEREREGRRRRKTVVLRRRSNGGGIRRRIAVILMLRHHHLTIEHYFASL